MSNAQTARRILENVRVLLQEGVFPGKLAVAVAEADALLSAMIAEIPAEPAQETPDAQAR